MDSEQTVRQRGENEFPTGNITYKTIKGRKYAYYQWSEGGKQRSRRVRDEEIDDLTEKIRRRKSTEREQAARAEILPEDPTFCAVKTGDELTAFAVKAEGEARACAAALQSYLSEENTTRVLVLCGLRRTGKTRLMREALGSMSADARRRAAFLQMSPAVDALKLNCDLKRLVRRGFCTFFVDDVTRSADACACLSLCADLYAVTGIKMILSGDGLDFCEASARQNDRCITVRTTEFPFREAERVLGATGWEDYICRGGTVNRAENPFATVERADEYAEVALVRNLRGAVLRNGGDAFPLLCREKDEVRLTEILRREVFALNRRAAADALCKALSAHDLWAKPTWRSWEQLNPPSPEELAPLREKLQALYPPHPETDEVLRGLERLDAITSITTVSLPQLTEAERTAVTLPGWRYAQGEGEIRRRLQDPLFGQLSLTERNRVGERALEELRGRLLQDLILTETQRAYPHCRVFRLEFTAGAFDIVIFDPARAACRIYEIKNEAQRDLRQGRHLRDEKKCAETEFRYGTIQEKHVIYRGASFRGSEIRFWNVEEYLRALPTPDSER